MTKMSAPKKIPNLYSLLELTLNSISSLLSPKEKEKFSTVVQHSTEQPSCWDQKELTAGLAKDLQLANMLAIKCLNSRHSTQLIFNNSEEVPCLPSPLNIR